MSPHLAALNMRLPGIAEAVARDGPQAALDDALSRARDKPTVAARLRAEKAGVALVTGLADLSGQWSLETVTDTLSRFADHALDEAIRAALRERDPDSDGGGFVAIALGKQGSFELNYSSDLDPILLYDPGRVPRRSREDPAEAAVRIARRVVELMQDRSQGDGYVFRIDLRLRPNPEATPVALPVEAAISYYESAALPWERAAFIRSRACAGDIALGREFLDAIQPFIWRRALDFTAIGEIRAISARVRDHYAQGRRLGPGYDVKRGQGGIREVEFYAQIHQMIFGGRDPALRTPATLDALAALAAAGHIKAEDAAVLADAYRLLRTVEHRLQMVDDRQTHQLPRDPAMLDNVAQLGGWRDGAALIAALAGPTEAVADIYETLAGTAPVGLAMGEAAVSAELVRHGLDPALASRIERWRAYEARALRSAAAREAFEAVLPALIKGAAATPAPAETLARFDRFLVRLPSGVQFFELLRQNGRLVALLTRLLGVAPSLAEALAARTALIDGLLDASAFAMTPLVDELMVEMGTADPTALPFETLLDRVRRRVAERRFALGVQLIEAVTDPLEIAAAHARLAEAALVVLARGVEADFARRHGRVPGGRLLVLGLGRLGGGVLTAASDLDLIYLFSGDFSTESDGGKPLAATLYFNRLAQRVTAALSAPTAEGALYQVDTRLRPSGNQGLLAVSIDSFAKYEAESAWTWEHMALARARPVFGGMEDRAMVAGIIDATLRRPRDPAGLIADVLKMRGEIRTHKPAAGPLDIKLVSGGLVDIEFLVHHAQLATGQGLTPDLGRAIDALALAGVLPAALRPAHDLLTCMLVVLRLLAPGAADEAGVIAPIRELAARAAGARDWQALLKAYEEARVLVRHTWRDRLGEGD